MKEKYITYIRLVFFIPAIIISILIFTELLNQSLGFPIFFLLFGIFLIFDAFCPLHKSRVLPATLLKAISIIMGLLFIVLAIYGFLI